MPRLPRISGQEAVQAFQKAGWELARQRGAPALWEVLQHPSADDLRWFAGQQ
jgi:predicted RNA binding protein YcfA (HicA-like mRNA interferase family)